MSFSEEYRSDNHATETFAIGAVGALNPGWWKLGYTDASWATFTTTSPSGRLLAYDGAAPGSTLADPRGLWLDGGLPGDPTDDVLFRQDIQFPPEHAHVKFLPGSLSIWPTAGVTVNHVYLFDQELDVSGGYPLTIPADFLKGPQAPGTGGEFDGLACNSVPPFTALLGRPGLVFGIDTIGAPVGSVGVSWKLVINGVANGCRQGYGGWEQ